MYATRERGDANHEHGTPLPNALLYKDDDPFLISSMDDLFSEALLGIQDLDVPTGYALSQPEASAREGRLRPSNAAFNNVYKLHNRQNSGTAIFGFIDHTRDLSLLGVTNDWLTQGLHHYSQSQKSIAPNDVLHKLPSHHHRESDFIFGMSEPDLLLEKDGLEQNAKYASQELPQHQSKADHDVFNPFNQPAQQLPPPLNSKANDFVVTKTHPKRYKFPPSPPPASVPKLSSLVPTNLPVNNYLARYLQELKSLPSLQTPYVNDIGPLLEDENGGLGPSPADDEPLSTQRYVPLPIQQPQKPDGVYDSNYNSLGPAGSSLSPYKQQPLDRMSANHSPYKQQPLDHMSASHSPYKQQPQNTMKMNPYPYKQYQSNLQIYLPQRGPAPQRLPDRAHILPERTNFQTQRLVPQYQSEHSQQYLPRRMNVQSLAKQPNPQFAALEQGRPLLPPPAHSSASHGSPEWHSSPEGAGLTTPSRVPLLFKNDDSPFLQTPTRVTKRTQYNELPLHNPPSDAFCEPQFFSDAGFDSNQHVTLDPDDLCSSPIQQHHDFESSSLASYYSSSPNKPLFVSQEDNTVDANETITQLTPMKQKVDTLTPLKQQLDTPTRMRIQWSPNISPSAKASQDVRRHIQQQTCIKSRIRKTSTLPPGELDNYWEGPDDDKNYTCTYKNCGKKFTRRYNVRSHIQTHLSDRPFACPHCPKRFVRQHDMNRHVKGHTEMRYSSCSCGKEFSRLDALKKHQLRNICSGGVAYATPNGVSKPHFKHSVGLHLGHSEADKLIQQLSSQA